ILRSVWVGVVGWVGGGPAGCARRAVRLIYAGWDRRTMVRRGEPLSRIERGRPPLVGGGLLIGQSRVPRALPGRHRPSRRDEVVGRAVHSIWVIAQANPASSRAAATAMMVRRLARFSRRVQVRCSRRWADQATAIASGGWSCWRSVSALPIVGRLR